MDQQRDKHLAIKQRSFNGHLICCVKKKNRAAGNSNVRMPHTVHQTPSKQLVADISLSQTFIECETDLRLDSLKVVTAVMFG